MSLASTTCQRIRALRIISIGVLSTLISLTAQASNVEGAREIAPHQQQASAPRNQVKVEIKQDQAEIVAASTLDLNVIYTPFKQVSLVQNAGQDFQIIDGALYFQPLDEGSFSIFLSEAEDPNSPVYQLTIVPSKIPLGQKIKLVPTDAPQISRQDKINTEEKPPRVVGAARHYITDEFTFRDEVVAMLAATATYIAEPRARNIPQNFLRSEDAKFAPYFIGNVLIQSRYHFAGPFYEIYVLEAINRSNQTLQLTNADFARLAPTTGEMDTRYLDEMAIGVGFYPQKVLSPQDTTSVILIRRLAAF